jgi:predicted nucleic acid-binding Zn finger protein
MTDLFDRLQKKKALSPEIREEVTAMFGKRGAKALAAIDSQRVKKYLDFFVVTGFTAEYVIDEDFCTCGDFMFRGRECWHLLAVRLAAATGSYVNVDEWYQEWLKK